MNRIDRRFKEVIDKGETAFIPYITAGDFGLDTTEKIIYTLYENGADLIEIGIPHSDPVADGPVIEKASCRALENGTKIKDIFTMVGKVRDRVDIPLLFMMYYNCILRHGIDNFIKECVKAGIDGLIIPDLPYEEAIEVKKFIEDNNIYLISFITPTSSDRIKKIVSEAKGFFYCVSSVGVTGERSAFSEKLHDFLDEIKIYSNIPRAVGFGISSSEQVKNLKGHCEGVIVGSAIVKNIEKYGNSKELFDIIAKQTKSLKK
jgi:tryptophan synthase alpha chain